MFSQFQKSATRLQLISPGLQRLFKNHTIVANFSNGSRNERNKLNQLWYSGQYKHAVSHFNQMNFKTDRDWSLLIAGFAKLKNLDMMFYLYDAMKTSHLDSPMYSPKPSSFVIGPMIRAYAQHDEYDNIHMLIEEMLILGTDPDRIFFTHLLWAHYKNPKYDLLKKAKEAGFTIDETSFNVIKMNAAQKKGDIAQMLSFFKRIREKSAATVSDYSIVLQAFVKRNDRASSIEYFTLMVNDGVRPTIKIINTFLSLFKNLGRTDVMMTIFLQTVSISDTGYEIVQTLFNKKNTIFIRAIQGKKLNPDPYTFTILIQAFIKEPPKAVFFWNMMMKHELRPSHISYHAMLKVYAIEEPPNMDKLQECWEEMKDSGYTPNSESIEIVAQAFLKLGASEQAMEMLTEFTQTKGHDKIPEHTYHMFMNIFAKEGNIAAVNGIVQLMHSAKWDPDYNPVTQNIILTAHYHADGIEAVIKHFTSIKKRGIRPHYQMYSNVIKMLLESNKIMQGCQLFLNIPQEIGYSNKSNEWGQNLLNKYLNQFLRQPLIDKSVHNKGNMDLLIGARPMSNSCTQQRKNGLAQVHVLINCILTAKVQLMVSTAIQYLNFVRPHCAHIQQSDELLFRIDRMIKILHRSTHNLPKFPNDLVLKKFATIIKDVQLLLQTDRVESTSLNI